MQIVIKGKDDTERNTAKVTDGEDFMEWAELEPGTWTKFHAVVKGQLFGIRYGVWSKRGRGRAFNGSEEQLCALEQYFRDNIRSVL